MPTIVREFVVPFRQFVGSSPTPRNYGPFRLDQFTNLDADKVKIWFTWRPEWPAVYPLFSLELYWNNALGPFGGTFGGLQPTKFGIPQEGVGMITGIPKLGNTKRDVTYADVSLKVYSTFSTEITIQALLDD